MKKLISGVLLAALFATSPILMDHAKDVYLQEVVSPKAMPVKLGQRVVASSFQLEWKGKRVTVTNNHVCSIMKRRKARLIQQEITLITAKGIIKIMQGTLTKQESDSINRKIKELQEQLKKVQSEGVVGKTLRIGDINRKILYNSPNHDICFLEPVGNKSFKLASSVHRGEKITVIGHPRGVPQSMTDGRIVGEAYTTFPWIKQAGRVRYLRSTAITYPGNSGSPVVNRYGNVVGILFAGRSLNSLNVNCVVPMEYVESELMAYFGN